MENQHKIRNKSTRDQQIKDKDTGGTNEEQDTNIGKTSKTKQNKDTVGISAVLDIKRLDPSKSTQGHNWNKPLEYQNLGEKTRTQVEPVAQQTKSDTKLGQKVDTE